MFTGIIQTQGTVVELQQRDGDVQMEVECAAQASGAPLLASLKIGDSVAVNGVCLTVIRLTDKRFGADVSRETLSLTTLGELRAGSRVNLEPALRAGDAMGGHWVSGHVDGLARVVERHADARSVRLTFEAPAELARYIASKGSICLDGVSLTVNEVANNRFGVNLIPHTAAVTTLGAVQPGSTVNLEVDMVARYLVRYLSQTGLSQTGQSG